jgi:hypothetical protein
MAVSGWFSSCATDEAISPIVTSRLVTWARSAGFGQLVRRQTRHAVDHLLGIGHELGRAAFAGKQRMAAGIGAEPQPVRTVGEQQFALRHRQHRHRRVQAFEHGGEALVRSRQLVADALGLGDVGHRGHPAGLLAARVDQRRDVHARVEQRAVLAHHAHLDAAGRAAAGQLLLQQPGVLVDAVVGPVRERRRMPDQRRLGEAGHGAERGVDIGDASFEVHRAHAGQHRVFHRAPEVRLLHQRGLDLRTPAQVAPAAEQHPYGQARQRHHHPEQGVADQADRGAVALAAQQQAVDRRRQRQLVGDRSVVREVVAPHLRDRARQRTLTLVDDGHRVAASDVRRHEVAQQRLDRVLDHEGAGEGVARDQRHVQLEHRVALAVEEGPRVHRLAQVARLGEGDVRLVARSRLRQRRIGGVAAGLALVAVEHGPAPGAALARRVEPGDLRDRLPLAHEGLGLANEVVGVGLALGQLAGHAQQLLLVADQVQADLLLRDLGVALQRFGLALELLVAQVPEGGNDRRQEQQHRHQRPERDEAVLPRRGLMHPPAAEPTAQPLPGRGNAAVTPVDRCHGPDYPGPPTAVQRGVPYHERT